MVKIEQIFFSHPDMTISIPIESPRRVDTCYAFLKALKVMQSDYMTKNKKAYIAYTKENVRAPKKK
jgi:hypothetical protein